MNLRRVITSGILALSMLLGAACDQLSEATSDSSFLVTEPTADGLVYVVALAGTLLPDSRVDLSNLDRGDAGSAKGLSDGGMLMAMAGDFAERIQVKYTAADGSTGSEEVSPSEGVVAIHGLLTVSDPDGEEGEQPPCWILVRDDIEGEGAELEVLLVPPKGKGGKPPQDGEQTGEGGEGETGEDGQTPPPPKDGQQPPKDGQQPPKDGQQPPPEGGKPPCGQGNPLPQYEGEYITVVGRFVEPKADAPCEGTPFAGEAVIPDEAADVTDAE